jgi:riboflavin biosynthesis pyrimidine reductase
MVRVQLIFSRSSATLGPVSNDGLVGHYRHEPATEPGRVRLRTNFISTLDGSIVGADGRSGSINTPSDHHVFALHRALADAIMVGAGTVRAEGYRAVDLASWQRDIRAYEGLAPTPTLVIISGSGEIDPAVATAADGSRAPVMIIATDSATGPLPALRAAGVEVLQLPGEQVDLRAATALLAERGLTRALCEGGPRLHRDLLAADLVDEVSLSLSPLIVGGIGLRSTSGQPLPSPRRFALHHALHADDDTVLMHYRRRTEESYSQPEDAEPIVQERQ